VIVFLLIVIIFLLILGLPSQAAAPSIRLEKCPKCRWHLDFANRELLWAVHGDGFWPRTRWYPHKLGEAFDGCPYGKPSSLVWVCKRCKPKLNRERDARDGS
jgi:hypothetical protein